MRAYNAQRYIPLKFSGANWATRMGWSREEFDALCRDFYDTIFTRYATEHGKARWGEKTPLHTWHVDHIARLFPDAVFVAIVRHPGASVASNVRRFAQNPKWGSAKWTASQYLRNNREIARQAARRPRRFVFLRYEDLVQQPEAGDARAAGVARRAVVGQRARAPRGPGEPRDAGRGRGPHAGRRAGGRLAHHALDEDHRRADARARPHAARRGSRSSTVTTSTSRCPHVRCAKARCSWAGWTCASGSTASRTSTCVRAPSPAWPSCRSTRARSSSSLRHRDRRAERGVRAARRARGHAPAAGARPGDGARRAPVEQALRLGSRRDGRAPAVRGRGPGRPSRRSRRGARARGARCARPGRAASRGRARSRGAACRGR